jgi:hypothetical protein
MPLYFTKLEKEEMLVDQLNVMENEVVAMVEEVKRRYDKQEGRTFILTYCQDPVIRMWMLALYDL